MDAQVLKFDPDISMRIHKPGLAKNGTASIQENFHIDDSGKYRFLETDDALFGAPQIPYPNVLLALNRYTRSTTFREEFIMRIPIFGKNLLGKVVEDDVVEVVELTMSEKTFDALSKAMHQTMWRDDKKYELYKEFHEYGIPENRIPEVAAKNMVAKNMNGLFHKVNERITKSGNA